MRRHDSLTTAKPDAADNSLEASKLYASALVWDNVFPIDLPTQVSAGNGWDTLDRLRAAGIDVVSLTLAGDNHNASQAFALCGWARRHVREREDRLKLVRSVADIDAARAEGRLAVILHFEGTRCFERDPDLIQLFYDVGIRQTLLAFNAPNSVGGGCAEPDAGLSAFGRRVVSEMVRVGMLVDLSHTGYRTSLDAIEAAAAPVLFSHSDVFAIHPSFRNLRDDQIQACAAVGGVIGVSSLNDYLGDPGCSTDTIFRHIDYLVQLAGPDHVALGLDFVFDSTLINDYARSRPDEWPMARDPAWAGFKTAAPHQLLELVQTMIDHGYDHGAIAKILGENLRRLCTQVWLTA